MGIFLLLVSANIFVSLHGLSIKTQDNDDYMDIAVDELQTLEGDVRKFNITINGLPEVLELVPRGDLDRHTTVHEVEGGKARPFKLEKRGCFFQDRQKKAAVNLCGPGLSGLVQHNGTEVTIKPKDPTAKFNLKEDRRPNMVERRRRSADEPSVKVSIDHVGSRVTRAALTDSVVYAEELKSTVEEKVRQRRQTAATTVTLELVVIADYSFNTRMGGVTSTSNYLLSLVNAMDMYYAQFTNPNIQIVLSSIIVMTDKASQNFIETVNPNSNDKDSHSLIQSLSVWLTSATNPAPKTYDHCMLVTGHDLHSGGNPASAGVAWRKGTCLFASSKVYACSVIEDRGAFFGARNAVHELGHSLNAPHDGDPESVNCPYSDGYIMGTSSTYEHKQYQFSDCSKNFIRAFVTSDSASCLEEPNAETLIPLPAGLPAAGYTINDICVKWYGPTYYPCPSKPDVCNILWCCYKTSANSWKSTHYYMGAMDGATGCSTADGSQGSCYKGECVHSIPSAPDTDGGWSSWGGWSGCSKSCGGGQQERIRTCTNPPPTGNGAVCSGASSQSQSCNTHDCSVDTCSFQPPVVPTGCTNGNFQITYPHNGVYKQSDCVGFFGDTGTTYCWHTGVTGGCCESACKTCGKNPQL